MRDSNSVAEVDLGTRKSVNGERAIESGAASERQPTLRGGLGARLRRGRFARE